MQLKDIIGDYDTFLDILFEKILNSDGFSADEIEKYQSDHICYRVSTPELYFEKKKQLLEIGVLLSEAVINGRPIASIKLHQPIVYKGRDVQMIELPMPKPGRPHWDGLEHMEMVIDTDFNEFINKHSKNSWVLGAITKEINPDIELEFTLTEQDKLKINHPSDRLDQHRTISVKFHRQPLDKVIEYELELERKQKENENK
ncbi:hypothetical protein CYY_001560 [Polysphondylium violaceum]|uniref:Uncharacterized protein n=1 Tax=Polysphondylium violaceum TaxID=133409 RepID=A0A8J4V407_9MYCE|nr:hypothetical protein CYY_001560 [Polysphondylium violaceum]